MKRIRQTLTTTTLVSALSVVVGCSLETEGSIAQSEQESQRVPASLAEAKADALETAASELKDALGDMRRERQSHEALNAMQREITELNAQARFWRAQARHGR